MKINTSKTREIESRETSPRTRSKTPARKKSSQKIGKQGISGRRILASLLLVGKLSVIFLIAGSLLYLGFHIYNSEKFQVRDMAIYGCREVAPERLEGIVRNNITGNILEIELEQLQAILEEVQWIRQVEIRRVLPSSLIIYVRERVPSVILEMQGNLMLADDEGILLHEYNPRFGPLDVPVFKGVVGNDPESYHSYQEVNSARILQGLSMLSEIQSQAPEFVDKISEVDISDTNNLKIILLNDTAEIYLGKRDFASRLQAFINSGKYEELKRRNIPIAVVDLRFDDRIIYRRSRATALSSSAMDN